MTDEDFGIYIYPILIALFFALVNRLPSLSQKFRSSLWRWISPAAKSYSENKRAYMLGVAYTLVQFIAAGIFAIIVIILTPSNILSGYVSLVVFGILILYAFFCFIQVSVKITIAHFVENDRYLFKAKND